MAPPKRVRIAAVAARFDKPVEGSIAPPPTPQQELNEFGEADETQTEEFADDDDATGLGFIVRLTGHYSYVACFSVAKRR